MLGELHWQQVAISAAEQCGRACLTKINTPIALSDWLDAQGPDEALKLVLHHRDTQSLDKIATAPRLITLLIGPEGGLSEAEIEHACNQSFISTTFGPRVMRTETAPVAALSLIQWLWGDFR